MTSPFSDELISAYLDGELTAEEQARVEKQLRDDAELRRMCDELRALRFTLQAMPAAEPARIWPIACCGKPNVACSPEMKGRLRHNTSDNCPPTRPGREPAAAQLACCRRRRRVTSGPHPLGTMAPQPAAQESHRGHVAGSPDRRRSQDNATGSPPVSPAQGYAGRECC